MKPMKRTFEEEDYELENVYNEDDERYLMANSSIWYS